MVAKKVVGLSVLLLACLVGVGSTNDASGQTTALSSIEETLSRPVQPYVVTGFQLQQYLFDRVPPLPSPTTTADWTSEAQRMRNHVLQDIAFHGWPREWVDSAPRRRLFFSALLVANRCSHSIRSSLERARRDQMSAHGWCYWTAQATARLEWKRLS